ncbi:MAG: ABC transporter permease [bacterium]|nr:ABC transporter permease [bacterium]
MMNVFRKENRRRMVFTVTLTLLAAVLSFGFVSRAVEYLAVRQELARLSDHYRAIGWLTSEDGDITRGAELIEASSYVKTADWRGRLWGTLTDLYNADLVGLCEEDYGVYNQEVLFWGTLKDVDEDWIERKSWYDGSVELEASRLVFTVSERISGYPDHVPEGGDINVVFSDELAQSEGWELPDLIVGERYLVRAYYDRDRNGLWNGYEMWKKAEGGHALTARSLPGNSPILPVEEGNRAIAVLASDEQMLLDELNRHSMNVVVTKDMSAMPQVQDASKRMFLTEGRWLDGFDDRTGAAVCTVHKDFAAARGLQIGDMVELTFRKAQAQHWGYATGGQDLSDWQSYDSEIRQYTIVGIFDYMPTNEGVHNNSMENMFLYLPHSSVPEEYICDGGGDPPFFSFVLKNPQDTDAFLSEVQEPLAAMGIKLQLIENSWEHFAVSANAMERTARVGVLIFSVVLCLGFVLIAFLYVRQNRKSFGIARAIGMPKGTCIGRCLSPMLFMSVAGSGIGALLSWRYALGEAEQMLAGMQEHTEMSLSVWWLAGLILALTVLLTAETFAGVLIMARRPVMELLRDASGGRRALKTTRMAPEEGARRAAKAAEGRRLESSGDERAAQAKTLEYERAAQVKTGRSGRSEDREKRQVQPAEAGKGKGSVSACRFVLRHMRRRPVHTVLAAVVSLAFLMAVAWMQVSIVRDTAQVDRLYETTEVAGELVKREIDNNVEYSRGGAYLTQRMIDWLTESGYVSSLYTEVGDAVKVERRIVDETTNEILQRLTIGTHVAMRSTEDPERFCEENHVRIDYADGYGPEIFETDWLSDTPAADWYTARRDTPIIVPEDWLALYRLEYGQELTVSKVIGRMRYECTFVIAGSSYSHDGDDWISIMGWNKIMIPMSAWKWLKHEEELNYSSIMFTLNPAFNRELDAVKEDMEGHLKDSNMALADADVMLWTSELRQVVEPFEKNLELMKLLFPVTVAVSVVAGGGLVFLLLLQRTEEAALLRVLGNSRGRTRRMLFSEPVLISLCGLLLGIAAVSYGMPEVSARQIWMFSGAYLFGAALGALAGTIHITRKKPLELLQVKE